jgi:hypothetical protein
MVRLIDWNVLEDVVVLPVLRVYDVVGVFWYMYVGAVNKNWHNVPSDPNVMTPHLSVFRPSNIWSTLPQVSTNTPVPIPGNIPRDVRTISCILSLTNCKAHSRLVISIVPSFPGNSTERSLPIEGEMSTRNIVTVYYSFR